MADLNLDDDFVPFGGFFHFFPKWKGRKYFFCNGKKNFYYRPGLASFFYGW